MSIINFIEFLSRPSKDLQAIASAGPALANAALLLAEGCPKKYVAYLRALYADNQLVSPNLDRVLKDNPLEDAHHEDKPTKEADHSLTSSWCIMTGDSVLQDFELIDDQSSFNTDEGCQTPDFVESPENSPVKDKIVQTPENEVYSETQQVKYLLRAMDNVDEIPASITEVDGILTNFETVSELPTELKQNSAVGDETPSFVGNNHLHSEFNYSGLELFYAVPSGKVNSQIESPVLSYPHGDKKTRLARTSLAGGKLQSPGVMDFLGENRNRLARTDGQASPSTPSTIGSTASRTLGRRLGNMMTGTDRQLYRLIPASSSTMLFETNKLKEDKSPVSEGSPTSDDEKLNDVPQTTGSDNPPKTFLLMCGRNRRDSFAVLPLGARQRLPLNLLQSFSKIAK